MSDYTVERLDTRSQSPVDERIAGLRELFPEVFREGKVDFEALQRSLGVWVDPGKERFGLTWPGKANCMRLIQQPSVGTLVPDREGSVDFDTTQNLIIEGDNLEVLKLLQKSYHGKVKMIYIDPPYNTGNDFIYSDDYKEPLANYLRSSGQLDANGVKTTTNSDAAGRYHSNWLNMMYPRLYLARNLLRDDGVIFVSIDDHEVHNLRQLMNELFGEENFIATVIWQRVFAPKNTAQHFSEDHDFIIVYARQSSTWTPNNLPRSEEADARYTNPDNDPRGPWASDNLTARNFYSKGTYSVIAPNGAEYSPPTGRYWTIDLDRFQELNSESRIWWGQDRNGMPRLKRFLSDVKRGLVPRTLWQFDDVGHTQEAKQELLRHVQFRDASNVLNSVKPTRLVQRMLQIGTNTDTVDFVLDFFAGSASTGHAVLKQNADDGGNRRFICVQFPEPLPAPEPGLANILDIGKQRLRSAGRNLGANREGQLDLDGSPTLDTGFRSYKLTESNLSPWNGASGEIASVERQIELFTKNVRPDRSPEDLLTEILLKAGYELTTPVKWLELAGNRVASVADGALLVCLDSSISLTAIEAMAARNPGQIVCLEAGFEGDDQRKVNALQIIRSRARSEDTTIAFKVV